MQLGSQGCSTGGARRIGLVAILACFVAALALPASASALTSVSVGSGGDVFVSGSPGNDDVTIRVKTDLNGNQFLRIEDPGGVLVFSIPPCDRVDAFAVDCPIGNIFVFTDGGDDTVVLDVEPLDENKIDEVILVAPGAQGSLATSSAIGATGASQTLVDGGEGNDTIASIGGTKDKQVGGSGKDEMMGGGGDDTQIGGPGKDNLSGQAGNDSQAGGPGNDRQQGGAGNDSLNCGPGNDDKGVGGPGRDKTKRCEEGQD